MSIPYTADTDYILSDGSTVTGQLRTVGFVHTTIPPSETASVVETATVLIFEYKNRGELIKDERGNVKESTHDSYFPSTSSVAVGHRFFPTGSSDYYEVITVADYDGHKECKLKEVNGR